jgi:hypothetical protein
MTPKESFCFNGGGEESGHAYLKEDEMLLASAHLKNNQLLHDWRANCFVNLRV